MSAIEAHLQQMKLSLPHAAPPAANYVPYVISGNMLFIAGQIPFFKRREGAYGPAWREYGN